MLYPGSLSFIQAGRVADAIPHFEIAKTMGASAFVLAWLAYAYGVTDDEQRLADEILDLEAMSLRGRVTAFNRALVALGRGDDARPLSFLEKAHATDSQCLGWLGYDHVFDPVRGEPRFQALLKKVNLAETEARKEVTAIEADAGNHCPSMHVHVQVECPAGTRRRFPRGNRELAPDYNDSASTDGVSCSIRHRR